MNIRRLHPEHEPPLDLLLTADPSEKLVNDYLKRGQCYTAEIDRRIAGVYVLLPTRPETAELVNIAVKEDLQEKESADNWLCMRLKQRKLKDLRRLKSEPGIQASVSWRSIKNADLESPASTGTFS